MVETTISAKKHIFTYGLLIGAIWIIYGILRNATGYGSTANLAFSAFELVLHITIISYSIYKYKAKNNGFLTLLQAIKIGLGIAIISALIVIIWDIIFISVIKPEVLQKVMKTSNTETAEQVLSEKKLLFNYFLKRSSSNLIYHLTFGLIISMLSGAIMQKNPDPFD